LLWPIGGVSPEPLSASARPRATAGAEPPVATLTSASQRPSHCGSSSAQSRRGQRWLGERLPGSVWATCSSWYVTADGRVTNNWPGSFQEYFDFINELSLGDYLTEAPRPEHATA
jgi:hypothetical protein